jgi:hypothetical protein
MAHEGTVIVGSGIQPLKKQLPVNEVSQERHLRGTQVVLLNPEDSSAGGSGVTTKVIVSTVSTKLPPVPMQKRRAIALFNTDTTATLYIGFDSGVTTATGWPVPPSTSLPIDLNPEVEIYGIASSAIDIRILELS